ncbi:MAG: hypothetical protein ACC628_17515, partial [Pirellulaceae bacterium]
LWIGVLTPATLRFSAMVAGLVVFGAFAGVFVLRRIPQRAFETLVLFLAGAAALQLILVH